MPELPEVETMARALRPLILNQTITETRNYWPRHIITPSFPELQRRVHGQRVTAVRRRGKYLLFDLSSDETLIIHLRMSGHLTVVDKDAPADKHVHTIFGLASGEELRFRDIRKFGCVYLVNDAAEIVGKLGPEPLEPTFTAEVFANRLAGKRRIIKPLLLDQHIVAGIGNIYADEALFYAGIRPERPSNTLTPQEITRLHQSIRDVLAAGVEREGTSLDTYRKPDGSKGDMQNALAVFRRTGEPCDVCSAEIQRIKLGGRSTHFCPVCQT